MLNVFHCFSEAFVLFPERCLVLLLNVAKVSVSLISKFVDLLSCLHVKIIVLLLAARQLIFEGGDLIIK